MVLDSLLVNPKIIEQALVNLETAQKTEHFGKGYKVAAYWVGNMIRIDIKEE